MPSTKMPSGAELLTAVDTIEMYTLLSTQVLSYVVSLFPHPPPFSGPRGIIDLGGGTGCSTVHLLALYEWCSISHLPIHSNILGSAGHPGVGEARYVDLRTNR